MAMDHHLSLQDPPSTNLMFLLTLMRPSLLPFYKSFIMSIPFPRRRWAVSGDWDSARPLITKMYKHEGRPLKEVMKIMETEHQFLAT